MDSQRQLLQALDNLDTKAGYSPLSVVGIYELVDALEPLRSPRNIYAHAHLDGTAFAIKLSHPLRPVDGEASMRHSFDLLAPLGDALEEFAEDIVAQTISVLVHILTSKFDDPTLPDSPSPFTPIPAPGYPAENHLPSPDSLLRGVKEDARMEAVDA